jgi:nitronate monooxygenase
MYNPNRRLLNTTYPIIQAPMAGGILSPQFIAKVCNSGMLGFIASGYLELDALKTLIRTTKSLLYPGALFGVNLFIEEPRYITQTLLKPQSVMAVEAQLNIEPNLSFTTPPTIKESEYIELLIEQRVPIVSCTFGFLTPQAVLELKAHKIKLIGTATSIAEVNFCLEHGADAVIIQGMEAGGHQATFLTRSKNTSSTLNLLRKVRKTYPHLTLIAAGGISSANAAHYLANQADYVQLGTAFMMTQESNLAEQVKKYMLQKQTTVVTNKITGKFARGITNKLIEQLKNSQASYAFPLQHYATLDLRKTAKELTNPEYLSLWAGYNPDNLKIKTVDELIIDLTMNLTNNGNLPK